MDNRILGCSENCFAYENYGSGNQVQSRFCSLSIIIPHSLLLVFPRLLGLPKAKTLYAHNPSRDRDIIVNSVFTTTRHFHVSPIHSRVSGDVL